MQFFDEAGNFNANWLSESPSNYDPNVSPDTGTATNGLNEVSGLTSQPNFWDDFGKTFNKALGYGFDIIHTTALANIQQAQQRNDVAYRQATDPPYTQQQKFIISGATIGAVVLLGLAAILISRKG